MINSTDFLNVWYETNLVGESAISNEERARRIGLATRDLLAKQDADLRREIDLRGFRISKLETELGRLKYHVAVIQIVGAGAAAFFFTERWLHW